MTSIPMHRSVNRSVKTCTECKQVKLRCDSRFKYPAPCTRCSTRHLQCNVDASFRRTPARKRVEDMARELEKLKSQTTQETDPTISPSSAAELPYNSSKCLSGNPGVAVVDASGLTFDIVQLDLFILDKESVIDCFNLFAEFLYPHFPVLDPSISIASIHSSSPFLFWTIITIVLSRQMRLPHASLSDLLLVPYTALLGTKILQVPLSIDTIQALTYLIIWPLGVVRQSLDPSWLYCGIAVNSALSSGLHISRPMQNMHNLSAHLHARATTWLGCFFASTTLGMFLGISPSINGPSDLEAIEQFVRQHPIPPEFAYEVMVQHTLAKFTSILQENSKNTINFSLVKIIETELDGLKTRFPTEWTSRVEMTLLVAKLHLYAMAFLRTQTDLTSREILLKLGLSVSLRIIHLCDKGLAFESTYYPSIDISTPELRRTLPKIFGRGLALATIFLLRYFALNSQALPEERELARNHIATTHTYFRTSSNAPADEYARIARLIETLGRQQPVDIDNTKLRIDKRTGWSLVDDTIEMSKDIRNRTEHNMPTDAPILGDASPGTEDDTSDFDFSITMSGFDPLEFSLPEDIWGDSLWGCV
ncbi:hypothetical protein K504DRAFT_23798 [Pleomassaria siparia CBS 279.74]|uniref:Zn(2)-C6 fungal-type domain-containing protein n=1 Tax=Pleomassaria siparia CBS 279.74 TaxID=1314801 RepID=A0A6G1KQX8_9PLEO|nr:hypothetical protein K504DRAFT_23798 [Pleomassaria siparia CBS 279.74]